MDITTYAGFVDAIEALSVAGVTRVFQGPPAALNSADLPAMWCQTPKGEEGAVTFQTPGGWPSLVVDLYVAVEPVAQNVQAGNFAAQVAMLDHLAAALRTLSAGRAPVSWSIHAAIISVGGTDYWGVTATVTGRG